MRGEKGGVAKAAPPFRLGCLENQHGVAVGVEAVVVVEGLGVEILKQIETDISVGLQEGGDKAEQGASREVEISKQGVDSSKGVGRAYEEVGLGSSGGAGFVVFALGEVMLDRPHGGCAHGEARWDSNGRNVPANSAWFL